jgi:uncharacterized protein (TIGR02996 family)
MKGFTKFLEGEELGFHASIHNEPDEKTIWLAYADWLSENGKSTIAEMIRHHTKIRGTPPDYGQANVLLDPGSYSVHVLKYNMDTYEIQLQQKNLHKKTRVMTVIVDNLDSKEVKRLLRGAVAEGAIPSESVKQLI